MGDPVKGEIVVIAGVIAWILLMVAILVVVLTASVPGGRIVP